MFKYLKSYASLIDKLFVESISYSFVDFFFQKIKMTKTQHATGKDALKTLQVLLHSVHRNSETKRQAKVGCKRDSVPF